MDDMDSMQTMYSGRHTGLPLQADSEKLIVNRGSVSQSHTHRSRHWSLVTCLSPVSPGVFARNRRGKSVVARSVGVELGENPVDSVPFQQITPLQGFRADTQVCPYRYMA